MNTNIEKEYKVLLSESEFQTLCALYPQLIFKKQKNTYYDTADRSIQKMKGAMRIREINDSFLFTLKLHKGKDLYEYECVVPQNDSSVFHQHDIQELLASLEIQGPFSELTSLTTYRGMIQTKDAEICFDESFYNGKHDYEIEYEYKKNHDGLQVFQGILQHVSIVYEKNCASKIKRALDSLL